MGKVVSVYRNFTIAPNDLINDKSLSLKAKGLWLYMNSKPSDWEFSAERIAYENTDGRDSVRSALKELENKGYMRRVRYKNEKGQWDYDHYLSEKPTLENPSTENPTSENPTSENTSLNKEIIQTNNTNKEKEKNNTNSLLSVWGNSDSLEVENENPKRKKVAPKKEKGIDESIEVLEYLNELRQKHLGVKRGYSGTKANLNFITARLSENNSIQDLKDVIQLKVWQWKKDIKMSVYLRPETLFNSTKFYTYIQEVEQAKNNPSYATEYKQSRMPKQAGNIQKGNGNKLSAEKFSALINSIPKDAR